MSEHLAKILWNRQTPDFVYETFDRTHTITYAGGISIKASSAPQYAGKSEYANPEEMLAGSVASCHMLTFLAIAAKSKLIVDAYEDQPVATLEINESGQTAVTRIRLTPHVRFGGNNLPSPEKLKTLHEKAHKNCFVSNSLKCQTNVEPQAI